MMKYRVKVKCFKHTFVFFICSELVNSIHLRCYGKTYIFDKVVIID